MGNKLIGIDTLDAAGHREDVSGPLFRPVRNPADGELEKALSPGALYNSVVILSECHAGGVADNVEDPPLAINVGRIAIGAAWVPGADGDNPK